MQIPLYMLYGKLALNYRYNRMNIRINIQFTIWRGGGGGRGGDPAYLKTAEEKLHRTRNRKRKIKFNSICYNLSVILCRFLSFSDVIQMLKIIHL